MTKKQNILVLGGKGKTGPVVKTPLLIGRNRLPGQAPWKE
jgi:hypothetical protein